MGNDMNWNFSNSYVTVDGMSYYLDETAKVAQFYMYGSTMSEQLTVPSSVTYNGTAYTVCSVKGRGYVPENASIVKSLILPSTIKELDEYTLNGLDNLRDIYIGNALPPALRSNFWTKRAKVHVPEGAIHAYRIADNRWNEFVLIDGEGKEVSVSLTTAGILASEVVRKADYLQEVNAIRISGELNQSDLNIVRDNMPNLISIDITDVNLTDIPDYWLRDRWSIEEIKLPKVLKSIGYYSFQGCDHLKTIRLVEGLTTIGTYAFSSCDELREAWLPSTLAELSSSVFSSCESLAIVHFSEGLTTIGSSAFSHTGLTSVVMPSTLKEIGSSAFSRCPLENVVLNEGLEMLRDYCFSNCSALREITLPTTLTYCYDKPFSNASSLKDIRVLSGVPPYVNGSCPISGVTMNDVVLHVPAMTQAAYKATTGWNEFYTIEPLSARPAHFATSRDFVLDIDDDLTISNYKPIMTTFRSDWNGESYGAITVNGNGAARLSAYNAHYDYNRLYESPSADRHMTSIVNTAALKADVVNTSLWTRDGKWTFFSLPYDVKVRDIHAIAEGHTSFVIRKYSGENRAMGDMNYTWLRMTADSTLHANQGYIVNTECLVNSYTQSYSGLNMPSASKGIVLANNEARVTLHAYPSEFTQNQGWNLIGNPYMCYFDTRYMDFTAPITVWNMRNGSYTAYSPIDDDYILCPGEAFFVQCASANQTIIFSREGRQTDRNARSVSNAKAALATSGDRKIINLTLTDGDRSDITRIVINENASTTYELDKDASKFSSQETPQIYSIYHHVHYAINERPMADGIITLGTIFPNDGQYTISLTEDIGANIMLIDTKEGVSVMLTGGEAYTFTAEEGTTSRFVIKVGDDMTGISEVVTGKLTDDGATYNLAGQRVDANVRGSILIKNGKKMIAK